MKARREYTVSTLGERVLIQRRRRRLTQEELANELGIATNTVARLERGLIQDLKGQTIKAMAELFDVSTGYLLGLRDSEGTAKDFTPAGLSTVGA